jgi:serine/threonine protein kinase
MSLQPVSSVQVGRGLLALYRKGFLHLDIKPDNIGVREVDVGLETPYPVAVLLDFGHARHVPSDHSLDADRRLSTVGIMPWGNTEHVAPELQLGLKQGSVPLRYARQPLFELGVVAFELCARRHPILGYPAVLEYSNDDIGDMPEMYPPDFRSLCRLMVRLTAAPTSPT